MVARSRSERGPRPSWLPLIFGASGYKGGHKGRPYIQNAATDCPRPSPECRGTPGGCPFRPRAERGPRPSWLPLIFGASGYKGGHKGRPYIQNASRVLTLDLLAAIGHPQGPPLHSERRHRLSSAVSGV